MRAPARLRGRRVVVMGLGVQGGGTGVVAFLRAQGAEVVATDLRDTAALQASIEELGHEGIRYVLGRHDPADFQAADLIVRNPAVPLESPFLSIARQAGASIEMEMSLFLRWCRAADVVGITGTRGKTTTATVLRDMLATTGRSVALAGNMRVSALAQLATITPAHAVLLELSSWQVEGLALTQTRTAGAIITNLMPDHLDRYPSLEAYAAAKAALVANQRDPDWAVLPDQDAWGDYYAGRAGGRVVRFDRERDPPGWRSAGVSGDHNRANLAAAAAAARQLGVPDEAIAAAVHAFVGVPDRQQLVAEIDRVRLYNDTTATIPEATLAALEAIAGPWVLIAGGSDKRLDFTPLSDRLRADARLRGVVLLPGQGTERLRPLLVGVRTADADNMAVAVEEALNWARPGDAVLLSPACASFGLFANEFDRGAQFVKAVQARRSPGT